MKLRSISVFGNVALIADYQYNSTVLNVRELKHGIEIVIDERTTENPLIRIGDCTITINEHGEVFANNACNIRNLTALNVYSVRFQVRNGGETYTVEVSYEPFENYELTVSINKEGLGLFVAVIFEKRKATKGV